MNMSDHSARRQTSRRLIQNGVFLFFLGLLTGLVVPMLSIPGMGLSSHLEGILNGFFLIILGLIWPRLRLSLPALAILFWLAIYGTYINWATTLLAAAWGAGATLMPMAALGQKGTPLQEAIINFGLYSLSLAMLATCVIVLWGLRGKDEPSSSL